MLRFLGILVVLLLVFAGIGWYRGWFHAESHNSDGQRSIELTVDKDKLNQDKASAKQEVRELEHKN